MRVYKIRNGKGLFSSGGRFPHFTRQGRVWSQLGHAKNHLSMLCGRKRNRAETIPDDWELVEFELTEVAAHPAREMFERDE